MRKLYRSRDERMVAGVAGGLAHYFNVDPTLVRLAFVAFTLAGSGAGLLAYLVLAIVMPLEPVPGTIKAEAEAAAHMPRHISPEEEVRREVQEAHVPEYEH